MQISRNPNPNISFSGLKDNLRIGDAVLRDFRREFPYLRSNTKIGAKILEQKKQRGTNSAIIIKLEQLELIYNIGIQTMRNSFKQKPSNWA